MNFVKLLFSLSCCVLLQYSFAQELNQKVLLRIDDKNIKVEDFIEDYYKNQGIAEIDKLSIRKDFKFFVNFKLKLAEAKHLQLDTLQHLITELNNYKFQLLKSMDPKSEVNLTAVIELQEINDHYRKICTDFSNGVYIFELMNKEVWIPAQDSLKLDSFFKQNLTNYKWPKRISASIINVLDANILEEVLEFAAQNDINGALNRFNSVEKQKVIVQTGLFEQGENEFLESIKHFEGVSKVVEKEGKLTFAVIHFIFEPAFKELSEIRGSVIADFQQSLEESWIANLKHKHKVKIYKRVLNKLAK